VEQDLTDEELVASVNAEPADSDSDSDINDEFVEETIKAPSLRDARQQLKGLAIKVSKMTVSRIKQSRQQNITAFFSAN